MNYTKPFCLSVTILLTLVTYCQKQLFFPTSDTGFIVPKKDTFLYRQKRLFALTILLYVQRRIKNLKLLFRFMVIQQGLLLIL